MDHHFISYARSDGLFFASAIHERLLDSKIRVWMDKHALQAGDQWDREIEKAIERSKSLLFVLTSGSFGEGVFRNELQHARGLRKPLIPLLTESDTRLPLLLNRRQYVDFTDGFERGFADLVSVLQELDKPRSRLRVEREYLVDLSYELEQTADPKRQRQIKDKMERCREAIRQWEHIASRWTSQAQQEGVGRPDPMDGQADKQEIRPSLERWSPVCRVGSPPWDGSDHHFQNRIQETRRLDGWLRNDVVRLVAVFGRAGIGKTAMVCRLLDEYEDPSSGRDLPDLVGIVYLSTRDSPAITAPKVLAGLAEVLPETDANRLRLRLRRDMPVEHKLDEILETLACRRVVVMIDGFEALTEPRTGSILDGELGDLLQTLLERSGHRVKVVVTTRVRLALLNSHQRRGAEELPIGKVPKDAAVQLLRDLDGDEFAGLSDAPVAQLHEAWRRTDGNPQALEAVYKNLRSNMNLTLEDLLRGVADLVPEDATEALVGKAFYSLDIIERKVVEALAVYERPVHRAAIDHLLPPELSGLDLQPTLDRLVRLHYVQRAADRYGLSELDRNYAFDQIPEDTALALLRKGADYFADHRVPKERRSRPDHLNAELMEIHLRRRAGEYEAAIEVLSEIEGDLLKWGHAREVLTAHQALSGDLSNPAWILVNLDRLGAASSRLGELEHAKDYYEEALRLAEQFEERDRLDLLVNLANTSYALADLRLAADRYREALRIAGPLGPVHQQEAQAGLFLCNIETGRFADAGRQHEELLMMAKEFGMKDLEMRQLCRGGYLSVHLGAWEEALRLFQDARLMAEERHETSLVAHCVEGRATVLADMRDEQALEEAEEAVQLADQVGYPKLVRDANYVLALARLRLDDRVGGAQEAIAAAVRSAPDGRRRSLPILALQGVIAHRAGDTDRASEAFVRAKGLAELTRPADDDNFALLDAQGLALAGLVLCGKRQMVRSAIQTFRKARSITDERGVRERTLALLNDLDPDRDARLTPVWEAISRSPNPPATRRR